MQEVALNLYLVSEGNNLPLPVEGVTGRKKDANNHQQITVVKARTVYV